ncbi:MAG: tail fiber domain-containing protein, partial [Mucilaginibacter sp.]
AIGNGGASGGDLYIGTATAAKDIAFLTGGGTKSNGAVMNNERMRIDGGGNVGIGTAAPAELLDVAGNIAVDNSVYIDDTQTNTGTKTPGLFLGGAGSGEVIASKRNSGGNQYGIDFYTASVARMAITTAGHVLPGANNAYDLGNASLRWRTIYAQNVLNTSDRRLKTNIRNLQYGLKEVMALQPVSFNWKTTPDTDKRLGLIAQEVRKIVPEVVKGDEAKENLSIAYTDLMPVLINAIKEQQKQIEELKKDIQMLKDKKYLTKK